MQTIMGIDPGETTGMCIYSIEDCMIRLGLEARTLVEIAQKIEKVMPDVVVVEDYVLGRNPKNAKPPIKVIGAVELVCSQLGIPMVIQSPGILKMMKKHVRGLHSSPHVRSAAAHIIYYLKKRRISC
jgi:hypothetical protein